MININLNNALKASHIGRLAGLLFFLLTQLSFAQLGNNEQVYDLNDPRNPNCPCHKYQKMADEEFKKLSKENKINQPEKVINIENIQALEVQKIQLKEMKSVSDSHHSDYSNKQKRKTLISNVVKHMRFYILRPSKTRKPKPNYWVCSKW